MRLPFYGRLRNPAFFERVPIMFTPTSLGNATQKPDGNPTKTFSSRSLESLDCETSCGNCSYYELSCSHKVGIIRSMF